MKKNKADQLGFTEVKYEGDFSAFLHELRSVALTTLKTPRRLLSAGCAGLWYFEWIDKYLGKPALHIGLEYYSPKPEGLPPHVDWIQQNVYAMDDVESESVDMVFSGQNVEHLWANELAGFLSEANRVLEQDGLLVVDSPNFPICQDYGWSHPEHITEFSVPQFTRMLGLHGFQIEQCIGLWGCQVDEKLLPLEEKNQEQIKKRISYGLEYPNDSFSWWIVAKKVSKPSLERERLLSLIEAEFSINWPRRVQRQVVVPELNYDKEADLVLVNNKFSGVAIYGPYLPLKSGKYSTGYYLSAANKQFPMLDEVVLYIDCAVGAEAKVIASRLVTYRELIQLPLLLVTLDITLDLLTFGVQVRLISMGVVDFYVDRNIFLQKAI